uniref:Sushi domain-containing protein n=1 Tax=Pelusios castaneus TaxID=367368 RepID=A0A8C8SBU0_9SAUR
MTRGNPRNWSFPFLFRDFDLLYKSCIFLSPYTVCAQPPNISHGQPQDRSKTDFVIGSSITYRCDRGFLIVGKASIDCVADEEDTPTWSEPTPQCKETRCPSPVVANGKVISGSRTVYTVANRAVFQCDPGYILKGSESIVCRTEGAWFPPVPICDRSKYKQEHLSVRRNILPQILETPKGLPCLFLEDYSGVLDLTLTSFFLRSA